MHYYGNTYIRIIRTEQQTLVYGRALKRYNVIYVYIVYHAGRLVL